MGQGKREEMEIKFSIDRKAYIFRIVISGLFVSAAVVLALFEFTGALLPFAGFFLVWGACSLQVFLKSPVFRLTGDTLYVSQSFSSNTLRLPLDSLTCIASGLLTVPRALRRRIFISNGLHRIVIPPLLNIDPRRVLELLAARTTALVEKTRNLHKGNTPKPGYLPPPELAVTVRKLQDQGMGEKVFLFKGPERKISPFRRGYRKICMVLYLMTLGLGVAVSESTEEFFEGLLWMTVFYGILFLLSYVSSRKKGAEWLLVLPSGIAMMGKRMTGEFFWHEAKGIKWLRARNFIFSVTGAQRSPSGLVLAISTRDSIYIPISDLYDVPLPCIQRILIRHARNAGARF